MSLAAADHDITETVPTTHPRTRSFESWRARLGLLASQGETDGPRVAEARSALSWWRTRNFLVREMDISDERADSLMDVIDPQADTEPTEPADPAVAAVAQ